MKLNFTYKNITIIPIWPPYGGILKDHMGVKNGRNWAPKEGLI